MNGFPCLFQNFFAIFHMPFFLYFVFRLTVVWPQGTAAVANAWNYIFRINKNEIKIKTQLLLCTKYANVPRAVQQIKLSMRLICELWSFFYISVCFFFHFWLVGLEFWVTPHNVKQLLQAVPKVTINSGISCLHFCLPNP